MCEETSWAAYLIPSLSASTSVCTERRSVNGGTTTTSTMPKSCFASLSDQASFCTRCVAAWWSRFIFQFPAISGVRASVTSVLTLCGLEDRDTRELLALKELQARATAGGDVAEPGLVEAQLAHGCGGVATADDAEAVRVDHRLRHGLRARGEGRELEDTHRAVPDDRPGVANLAREQDSGVRTDVQAHPAVRDRVSRHDVVRRVRRERIRHHDVGRQHDLDAGLLGLREVALDRLDLVCLEQRRAHAVALRGEEREGHAAADEQAVRLGQQVGDHPELVGDLRATEDDDVRALRVVRGPTQRLDLCLLYTSDAADDLL